MKTTLGEIMSYDPCGQGMGSNKEWDKLISFLGTDDLDTKVKLYHIFDNQDYRDYCLFCAEVAESVLFIFEEKYSKDDRPKKAIEGIRDYYLGNISFDELKELSIAAGNASWDARAERAASWAAGMAAWAASAVVNTK